MRFLTPLCAALLLAALSGCVNLIVENPTLNEIPQTKNDEALVYFFKSNKHDHSTFHHHDRNYYEYVKDDGNFLGAVTEGSFFFDYVAPGEHEFSCTTIELEAGQTYYLEHYVAYGRIRTDYPKGPAGDQPLLLCPLQFVLRSPKYAQPIIAELTYTIVRKD